jgi:beta-hydroxylase
MPSFLSFKLLIPLAFLSAGLYVHLRGQVRHRIGRQLSDHSTFLAPLNVLMYWFSSVPSKPYVDLRQFPELDVLENNWQTIRDEGLSLFDEGHIRAAAGYTDIGFNSFFRTGWKRFYLNWYGDFLPSARGLCPKTTELLAGIPSVRAAMFAILPPGSKLVRHRDPFAGSLRYHLGLKVPQDAPNCRIFVDGQSYHWKEGEAVMFDETYIHYAENLTDETRLILFCDIERPLNNPVARWINREIGWRMIKAAATQNVDGEPIGGLNKAFAQIYKIRVLGKRLKAWNKPSYYAVKWSIFGGLFYLLFF